MTDKADASTSLRPGLFTVLKASSAEEGINVDNDMAMIDSC